MRRPPGGRHAVLLGFFLAAGVFKPVGAANAEVAGPGIALTAEEQAWLDAQPAIRVGNNPAFEPIDFDDERGRPAARPTTFATRWPPAIECAPRPGRTR